MHSFSRSLAVFGRLLLLVSSILVRPGWVRAQAAVPGYLQQPGSPDFAANWSIPGLHNGYVNLANGNLHLEIPIASLPERGGSAYTATLTYDSRFWQFVNAANWAGWSPLTPGGDPYGGAVTSGGWQYVTSADTGHVYPITYSQTCGDTAAFGNQSFVWVSPSGISYNFPIFTWHPAGAPGPYLGPCQDDHPNGQGSDDSGAGYYMVVTNYDHATIYAPDGTQVYPQVKDTNGNFFSYSNFPQLFSGDPSGDVTVDTVGRAKPVVITNNCNGDPTLTCYDVLNSSGGRSRYVVTTVKIAVCTNFSGAVASPVPSEEFCPGGPQSNIPAGPALPVITKIVLPDGSSYAFTYDAGTTSGHYGLLTGVTLPAGGQISFSHGVFVESASEENLWASSYSMGGGTWNFNPQVLKSCLTSTPPCTQQVTVTKPTNDQVVYGFTTAGRASWNSSIQYYKGAAGNGNQPLVAIAKDVPFDRCLPNNNYPLTITTTNLTSNGTIQKKEQYFYSESDGGSAANGQIGGGPGCWVVTNHNQVNAKAEYGYGTNAVGPLVRTTYYQYTNLDLNTNRLTKTTVCSGSGSDADCGGSGTKVAQAVYEYDNYSSAITSSGATQHDTSYNNARARGNQTAVSIWRNSDGAWLTKRNQYDDAGNIVSTADPKGNVTSYSYADLWADTQCKPSSGSAAAYRTTTTDPFGNSSSMKFNSCTGKRASTTDANGQIATAQYEATFDRPQLNAITAFSTGTWNDYTSQTQIDSYTAFTNPPSSGCTGCVHHQKTIDDLGRASTSTIVNDPDGAVSVTNSYDANGRVSRVSNPYRGTDAFVFGGETYTYDSLDRKIAVTHADGSVAHIYYGADAASLGLQTPFGGLGYPTLYVDEAGNKRQTWTDASGHLAEVDEFPTSGAYQPPAPGNPATGSVTIGGTEQSATVQVPTPVWKCTTVSGHTYCNWVTVLQPKTMYDTGTVRITVNGHADAANYGQYDTSATIAQNLANAINGDGTALVTASPSGATVQLTARSGGAITNYSLAASSQTSSSYFGSASFNGSPSGSYLAGGTDSFPGTPVYSTLYTYDTVGNLLSVSQNGSAPGDSTQMRTRTFTYNSLSQLITAANPETGTITYSYDSNDNVHTKTDARGITITYNYDALNRLTSKTYSNGEPVITYTYDQGKNAIGHRSGMTDASGSTSWAYDGLGRVSDETRTIRGITKTLHYDYDALNNITAITYPDGAKVSNTPDAVGRQIAAADIANGINYVQHAKYTAEGKIASFLSGQTGNITNTYLYNPRLQICREVASTTGFVPSGCSDNSGSGNILDFEYDFHYGNNDNGNLYAAINHKDTTRSQSYTYDPLNRLLSAKTWGTMCPGPLPSLTPSQSEYWGENFSYDAWGNLTGISTSQCSAENTTLTADSSNRLIGFTYDASGNMTGANGTPSRSYNAEGQAIADGSSFTYVYDGDGQRVAKINNATGQGTLYWGAFEETDLAGNPQSDYVFFNSARVARRDVSQPTPPVYFYFANQVQSVAILTDAGGKVQDDADYYPFGGTVQFAGNVPNHFWFGDKERDETGVDYFGARYYYHSLGRFVTPDWSATVQGVPYANFADPQSLNLYAYTRNLPITRVDPDGHCDPGSGPSDDAKNCSWARVAEIRSRFDDSGGGGDAAGAAAAVAKGGASAVGPAWSFSGIEWDNTTNTLSANANWTTRNKKGRVVYYVAKARFAGIGNKEGKPGQFLGVTITQSTARDGGLYLDSSVTDHNYGFAVQMFGRERMSNMGSDAATPDPLSNFARMFWYDMNEHPFVYVGHAAAGWEPKGGVVGEIGFIGEVLMHPEGYSDVPLPPEHYYGKGWFKHDDQ